MSFKSHSKTKPFNFLLYAFENWRIPKQTMTMNLHWKSQNLSIDDPNYYGYRWIDLDEYYQSVNGLNSIGETPEELEAKTAE